VAAQDEKAAHQAMLELIDWAFIDTTSAGLARPKIVRRNRQLANHA
jgi:hypothetical protein